MCSTQKRTRKREGASPPLWLTTNLFRHCARISAGWRHSPYPAYERLQYQTVMQLAVGPRKRSATGQFLKIARCQQSERGHRPLFYYGSRLLRVTVSARRPQCFPRRGCYIPTCGCTLVSFRLRCTFAVGIYCCRRYPLNGTVRDRPHAAHGWADVKAFVDGAVADHHLAVAVAVNVQRAAQLRHAIAGRGESGCWYAEEAVGQRSTA